MTIHGDMKNLPRKSLLALLPLISAVCGQDLGNEPPTVDLPQSSFERVSSFVLVVDPSCDDDGFPLDGEKLSGWDYVSGPANGVQIANEGEHRGRFTFSQEGSYGLRFIASDGEYESSRDFFVEVSATGIVSYRSFEVLGESYRAARQAWNALRDQYYPSGVVDPTQLGFSNSDFHLAVDSEVIVTLLWDGASYRNSIAWFDANEQGTDDGRLIWQDVATGPSAPLSQGSRASLGLLPAGTDLRFYLIKEGAGVGSEVISQVASQNLNSKEMAAGRFPQGASGCRYLAFEDRLDGDESYDDVVIQIEVVPVGKELAQHDGNLIGQEGLASDRGSRGVQALLQREGLAAEECEILQGVFQMPADNTSYQIDFLDDRTSMKFTLGVCPLDTVSDLASNSLLFREQVARDGVIILDDRLANPGGQVPFEPHLHGLLGKRVFFYLIPNNTPTTYLRNAWRYTPRGNGENTKRQPLFSIAEANPGGEDQFLTFGDPGKTLLAIEDYARAPAEGELGADSDESFDDVQIRITPGLLATERHPAYYGKTIDYTLGYESSDGLAPSIVNYDLGAIMKNSRGSRRWDLLFTTLTQPDGALLVSEFGESLPIADSGALSVNIAWEEGERGDFFIEQQRYGADVIETGIILEDSDLIADGIKMIDWGFARQGSDGSFPGTGDAVHSSSLFLEAAARAGLALKQYKPRTYRRMIRDWRRKTHLLAHWFIDADDIGRDVNLEPFGHRYFLRAAAIEQAARLTRDRSLDAFADAYAVEGMARQGVDGTMAERGGFDASYQMVGMTFASRYFATARNAALRQQVTLTMWHGISRFLQDVELTGEVLIDPSSRTATETSRSGAAKNFDFKHATRALVFADEGLLMEGAEEAAELILDYYEVLGD